MSNNNNTIVKSAQDIVNQLKSFRGTDVTVNIRSIWVKCPKTGKKADALKGMGFKYAESKGAWWYTYNATPTPTQVKTAQKSDKTAPKGQKAQAQKASAQKAEKPKAEKTQAPKELTPEQKALVDKYARMFPSTQVSVDRTWVWLKCTKEFGKEHSDALKAEGFWYSSKREEWYRTPEHAQMAQAQAQTKACAEKLAAKTIAHKVQMPTIQEEIWLVEPKKAQPKAKTAKKPALKSGVVSMAGLI